MTGRKKTQKQKDEKPFWETFPGILTGVAAILTAIGSLIATLMTTGIIHQPTPHSSKVITITLENKNCVDQDYYVDNVKVISVKAGTTGQFQTTAGEHNTYACLAGTKSCAVASKFNWIDSTYHYINVGEGCTATSTPNPVMITVTLTNNNCHDEDFYVDGIKSLTVKANSVAQFQLVAGAHDTMVCTAGSNNCGENIKVNWQGDIGPSISRDTSCP